MRFSLLNHLKKPLPTTPTAPSRVSVKAMPTPTLFPRQMYFQRTFTASSVGSTSKPFPLITPQERKDLLFHRLPVVEAMVERGLIESPSSLPLEDVAVVCVQHSLKTSLNLIEAILSLGAKEENVFVLGKHYSECPEVAKRITRMGVTYHPSSAQVGLGKFSQSFIRDINWLWRDVINSVKGKDNIRKVLILDHGGHAMSYVPAEIVHGYKVVGIEKTTGGLITLDTQGLPPFPLIGVANCAAKRVLESPLIAEAVVDKLSSLIPITRQKLTCGVVGYGAVGEAITNKLLAMGHKVIVHDNDNRQLQLLAAKKQSGTATTTDLSALLASAEYIFSCTGHDVSTQIEHFRLASRNKTLISCSSEDKEFLTLLQLIQRLQNSKVSKPLADITYTTDMEASIRILRGGFPVNFDASGESVPANDIQLTRCLVLAGIIQAARIFRNESQLPSDIYKLDSDLQRFVVNNWMGCQPSDRFSAETRKKFQMLPWIAEHSGGRDYPSEIIDDKPSLTL